MISQSLRGSDVGIATDEIFGKAHKRSFVMKSKIINTYYNI